MPRLRSLPRYWSIERAARAKRLTATHAVHADAARFAALQNNIAALGAFDFFNKDVVAPPEMRRDVLALALERPLFCSERLAVLSCLRYLPQSAVVVAQYRRAVNGSYAVAGPP